jgi:hypothetical protein
MVILVIIRIMIAEKIKKGADFPPMSNLEKKLIDLNKK